MAISPAASSHTWCAPVCFIERQAVAEGILANGIRLKT
jgi:hypothetical protein